MNDKQLLDATFYLLGASLFIGFLFVLALMHWRQNSAEKDIDMLRGIVAKLYRLVILLLIGSPVTAEACNRCGHAKCIYAAPVVHASPVVHQKAADVFVVQNVYPGVPLVPQGSSLYGGTPSYGSLTDPVFFDPNRQASDANELSKALLSTLQSHAALSSNNAAKYWELQAPALEAVTRGQAAAMVLKSAGLDPAHNAAGQQSAVVISRDAHGQVQVQQLSAPQVAAITANVEAKTAIRPRADVPEVGGSVISKYCGACHGVDLQAPKAGLFIDADASLGESLDKNYRRIRNAVLKKPGVKAMPPADSPQIPAAEVEAFFDELDEVIATGDGK